MMEDELFFKKLDSQAFESIGIRFKTEKVAQLFGNHIRFELEMQIGEAINSRLSYKQGCEFDKCEGAEEVREWLEKNLPDYREIIKKKEKELKQEIIKYRDEIRGVIKT